MNNWADVDNSLQKSMGDAAYTAMVKKLTALTISREINVYRFREDLSYSTQAPAATASSATR